MSLAAVELRTAQDVRDHARVVSARIRAGYSPEVNVQYYQRQLGAVSNDLAAARTEIDNLKTENNILRAKLGEATGEIDISLRLFHIPDIQRAACNYFGISWVELSSKRRTADVVYYRQVTMYLCKIMTLHSLPEIGRAFGGRDHTTALHAIRKIEERRKKSPELDSTITTLKAIIQTGEVP